ncbi:MATE family efflux transporter [Clostridium oceanicum]|uniref:Multidrug export protein MepA n=1 Tax=Clostridium oceanicum TaxID=1543 RepID=A0ABN1JND4_9CLOT
MVNDKSKFIEEGNISKVLMKLAVPSIIAMLISAVYNIVDTLFVSMLNNTSAIGAVSIVFPLFILVSAFGQMFGVGSASYISRLLGEKNREKANKTASVTFFTAIITSVFFTAFGMIFIEEILKIFGASSTIMPYAKGYGFILVSGSIFTILNMTLNNMIRAEGNAKYSMIAISLGAILNIVLDPIFMFTFKLGINGASLATVVAQGISTFFLIMYYIRGKSYVKISLKRFRPSLSIYKEILKIGVATLGRQSLSSLSMALMNIAAKPYGDAAVASMGIVLRVISIAMFVIFGYNQGFQPVVGYNYGAKRYDRVIDAIKISLKRTTIFCSICAIIFVFFSTFIISAFSDDLKVIEIGSKTLRIMSILLPSFGFQQVYASLFQALGRGKESIVLSTSKQGIFLIPSVLILPRIFGLEGVMFSNTVADFFTIVVTLFLSIKISKELKKLGNSNKELELA